MSEMHDNGAGGGQADSSARRMAANRRAFMDAITPETLEEIMEVVFTKAMKGKLAAARLWLQYAACLPPLRRGREGRGG